MRQIILDTETTGLSPKEGHRIIEIGCVEMINRQLTGRHYQVYINPERNIDQGAVAVHGLTRQFLSDKPVFSQIAQGFLGFIGNDELIIHNAAFDLGFLDHEMTMIDSAWSGLKSRCSIIDTLTMARDKHPGQRNSLDALCKRYSVDNTNRELHGALLDAEILALVYLTMTQGQNALNLELSHREQKTDQQKSAKKVKRKVWVKNATDDEERAHQEFIKKISS